MRKAVLIDWTLTAQDLGVATDVTWIRHIREKTKATQAEAEAEFNRAVQRMVLRCDSDACQLFYTRHGIAVYVYAKKNSNEIS
jgi:hypothetical protein